MDTTVTAPASKEDAASEPSPTELPARFEVRATLGAGAMGTVYRAFDTLGGREVAIKVLRHRADAGHSERFLREARTVAGLSHPHVVTVHEVDVAGRYLVLALADRSLADEISERGPLGTARVRTLATQLLSALACVHEAGIVHRDIKPSNILLSAKGDALLADFGVAQMTGSELTATGEVVGTPRYMAPEQLRGVTDAQVDVFGLGGVLYEAATGQPPSDVHEKLVHALRAATRDRALAGAIAKALEPDRTKRHPDAAAFARALVRSPVRVPRGVGALILGAAALGLVGVVSWPTGSMDRPRERAAERPVDRPAQDAAEPALLADAHVVALLPFADRREDALVGFAASGIPHIVGMELRRRSGSRTLGYYQLLDHVRDVQDVQSWENTASQLGATVLVDGTVSPGEGALRVVLRARRLGRATEPAHEWERSVPADELGRAVRELAAELTRWMGETGPPAARDDRSLIADLALSEGLAALDRHDLAAADAHLERARVAAPESAEISYYRAIVSWWRGDPPERSLAFVGRASEGALDEQRRLNLRGLQLLIERQFFEAIGVYEAQLERDPADREALYGLFEALFHAGYGERAITVYRRLAVAAPRFQLGAPHVEAYYLSRADPAGTQWLIERSAMHDNLVMPPRIAFAERRYAEAIPGLHRLAEEASLTAGNAFALRLLAETHLVHADLEGARLATGELSSDHHRGLLRLAHSVASGAPPRERVPMRVELERATERESSYQTRLAASSFDLAEGDASLLERDLQLLDELQPGGDLRTDLLAVFVALRFADPLALGRLDESRYDVVREATAAAVAELEERWPVALAAWARAIERSPDGRLVPMMHAHRARAARSMGESATARRACFEATHPRIFDYCWPAARLMCEPIAAVARQHQRALEALSE